jgi:glycosyltransferase involved in cell wall biosynthesis
VARHIRRFRPQVIFFSDSNLGFLLFHLRRFIGVPYRLLYSNSGPGGPRFPRADFIHQVAPLYMEQSIAAGEPPGRHMLVPFGISTPPPPQFDAEKRRTIRSRLGMPLDRPVVLSVGWISRQHKRMDYTISEIARMPTPRPFLQLLGAMDTNSAEVVEMGRRLLGPDGFAASSVPYRDVADYYRAADAFVLASLKEGFGRVYLEALMHGLPVIAHDYPVMRYVLNSEATFIDMATPGALSAATAATLAVPLDDRAMKKRWQSVYDRFDWRVLAPDYARMFAAAAVGPLPARDAHLDANRHPV